MRAASCVAMRHTATPLVHRTCLDLIRVVLVSRSGAIVSQTVPHTWRLVCEVVDYIQRRESCGAFATLALLDTLRNLLRARCRFVQREARKTLFAMRGPAQLA